MLKDNKLMDLQLFADGDSEDIQDNQTEETVEEKDTSIEDMFANEDFQKMFQSELDKRISSALKTNNKKWQKKLEDEKKRADMTKEEILAEKEREIQARELKLEKISYFKENDIPIDFVDYINVEDIDDIAEKADTFKKLFDAEVQKAVEERLKQSSNVPPKGSKNTNTITLEDIGNMSTEEINENWDTVRELLKTNK